MTKRPVTKMYTRSAPLEMLLLAAARRGYCVQLYHDTPRQKAARWTCRLEDLNELREWWCVRASNPKSAIWNALVKLEAP